ncbi:hypothetical protein [Galbibacter mesophilus]|uniref:hypothetical protein n=1 Tax=Galbibacter mesophilus TaxID=379069 RepID=UPI00191F6BFA|nr:hypothetical protein [Galbibacter mesophilus]MCM5664134.1 hypothetical protein [Galbibacter mesophilus]
MNLNKKDWLDIFENSLSWIVVLAMFIYGGAKIIQFEGAIDINKTIPELSGMEIMWAFYGYSKSFALTLGALEIIGGLLILFKKTRIIGCLFTTTILVNVILQDIYFDVNLGALKAALIYQTLLIIILWIHRQKLINGIKMLVLSTGAFNLKTKTVLKFVIAFLIFATLRILEYFITTT